MDGGRSHGAVKSTSNMTSDKMISGAKTTFQGVRAVLCWECRWKKRRRQMLKTPLRLQHAVVAASRGIRIDVERLGASSSGCVREIMLCGAH